MIRSTSGSAQASRKSRMPVRSSSTGPTAAAAPSATRVRISASTCSATAANRSALSRNWWYRAPGHPGRPHDLLGPHAGVTAPAEQRARGGHQLPPGRLGAEIVLGPGHRPAITSCHTYCLYVILIQTACMLLHERLEEPC